MYMGPCASICAPFGKVCNTVQGEAKIYGTEFMSKLLAYVEELLGAKPYYGVDLDSHGKDTGRAKAANRKGRNQVPSQADVETGRGGSEKGA